MCSSDLDQKIARQARSFSGGESIQQLVEFGAVFGVPVGEFGPRVVLDVDQYRFAPGGTAACQVKAVIAHHHHVRRRDSPGLRQLQQAIRAGNSRGFSRGSVYNRAGKLVASVTKEGLIRHRKDWA